MENNSIVHQEDEFENLREPYTGSQLLAAVWTRPRHVIRYLRYFEQDTYVLPLILLFGVVQAFERAAEKHTGDTFGLSGIILLALVMGPFGGLFTVYVSSLLLGFTGQWLGGKADTPDIRVVMAWSSVPFITILLLLPAELVLFGNELFSSDQPSMEAAPWLVMLFALPKMVLSVWTLVLLVVGLSEAQGFSVGKALLNLVLAVAVVVVPLTLLMLLLLGLK